VASEVRPRTVPPPSHYEGTEITTIVRAVLRAMGATLKNLFRKPITVHYPDKERQYPSRYRGLLALTYDKETGELHRLPPLRVRLSARRHQSRDAEEREAELREDVHAGTVRV
jgi:hypothetical protein